jgi:hypothetical protein
MVFKNGQVLQGIHLPALTTYHVVRANTVPRSVLGTKGGYMECDTIPDYNPFNMQYTIQ